MFSASIMHTTCQYCYIQQSVKIEEWWPNGYGKQALYDLYVFFEASDGEMSTKKIRMGFRTVELIQDYVSANKSLGKVRIEGSTLEEQED